MEHGKLLPFEYAIIEFNPTKQSYLFKNSEPTSLTEEEIIKLEKIVGPNIQKIIDAHNKDLEKPNKYIRQYVAVQNQNGEKEVFIQCILETLIEDIPDWKTYLIQIADGGDNIIYATVNLTKEKYTYLGIGMDG